MVIYNINIINKWVMMKGICLNGWNNTAPTELNKWHVQKPMMILLLRSSLLLLNFQQTNWVYKLYNLMAEKIKMGKGNESSPRRAKS